MTETLAESFARLAAPLERALRYMEGSHTLEDIWLMVADGRLQFWAGEDSAVLTQLVEMPRRTEMHILLAGGRMSELREMLHAIVDEARLLGCAKVTLMGRPGWSRSFLMDEGWRVVKLLPMQLDL